MKNNGGPAFPFEYEGKFGRCAEEGMTLRDYFASQVIIGMLSRPCWGTREEIVKDAYKFADTMLQIRDEK